MKDLLRKGFLICLLVLVASVFVSCGGNKDATGGGSGNGGGTGGGETVKYDLKYKTYLLFSANSENAITQSDIDEMKADGSITSADYSISGTTVTLTDSGFDKFLTMMSDENPSDPFIAIAVYEDEMIMPIEQSFYEAAGSILTPDVDFTLPSDNVVLLTATGYEKMVAYLYSLNNGGNGDNAQS